MAAVMMVCLKTADHLRSQHSCLFKEDCRSLLTTADHCILASRRL